MTNYIYSDPLNQLDDNNNIDKYITAGKIVSNVLNYIVAELYPNIDVSNLCTAADNMVTNELKGVYKDIKFKGIVMPTCISVNNVAGYNRPTLNNRIIISDGDIIKIELGAHIDGYPAVVCYTKVIGNTEHKIDDKRANVIKAVVEASREVRNMLKPGIFNTDIVKCITNIANKYGVSLPLSNDSGIAPGILSYQMSRYVIDGFNNDDDEHVHAMILHRDNPNLDFSMRSIPIENGEVYGIDILMTTGNGKMERCCDTVIFKRNIQNFENLKLQSSKTTLSLFKKEPFPQNMSYHINPKFKLGLKECLNKGLISEYPIMAEKNGEFIARIKFTVICLHDKTILVTGRPADEELAKLI